METFQELQKELMEAAKDHDTEVAHQDADDTLVKIALHTSLTAEERRQLVELYQAVEK